MQLKGVTSQSINLAWDSFGKFISNKLRQGRGVKVPKFGTFTFSAPFVSLNVKKKYFFLQIFNFCV